MSKSTTTEPSFRVELREGTSARDDLFWRIDTWLQSRRDETRETSRYICVPKPIALDILATADSDLREELRRIQENYSGFPDIIKILSKQERATHKRVVAALKLAIART